MTGQEQRIKISELPTSVNFSGLWTLGYQIVDGKKASVKVSLDEIYIAYTNTVEATKAANTATTLANEKATLANNATVSANKAADNANNAAGRVETALSQVNAATTNATTAADNANAATQLANTAADKANKAADNANAATQSANTATSQLMSYVTEYNVSKLHPTGGNGGTNKYDIAGAIAKIPAELRVVGNKCTFIDDVGYTRTYEFQGGNATDVNAWKQIGYQGIVDAKMLLFIDLWKDKSKGYGNYNPQTGFFELFKDYGGFADITYKEALRIFNIGVIRGSQQSVFRLEPIRINMPMFGLAADYSFVAYQNTSLEFCCVTRSHNSLSYIHTPTISWKFAFENCKNLRKIFPGFHMTKYSSNESILGAFLGCEKLEYLKIKDLYKNLDIPDSPLLLHECFRYIVDNKVNTEPVTITVHPTVYAKLTDTTNLEWNKLLTDGTTKNISFATKQ